ncbi:MAG: ATP-binding protein [Deltaproteobacteria bacterium]|nr:ATP-binding protein [Deltaproteobacteria bacterium]
MIISLLFFSFWQKLNNKVEVILKDQFNQQQLMLARKIGDNVESYFDFLENALMGYAGLFQTTAPKERELDNVLMERFARHQRFGILAIVRYNPAGTGVQVFTTAAPPPLPGKQVLPAAYLQWARDPVHRGHLFLSKTFEYSDPPWQGRRLMRFLTPLYWGPQQVFSGVLEFLIDPFFICQKVTADVRSGQTGYAWIIDQDEIFLAHYEKDFVGHNAIQIRLARNPKIVFRGLRELDTALLAGKEGMTEYDSGWHREKLGPTPKLAAYTPINFSKGLITGVTELEDPAHNLWGVAVVAPVQEVSGQITEVLHQELFLAGLFFIVVLLTSIVLIVIALAFNKTLVRQVALKTRELLESQERLMHSERFAAVGEAAAYVSHEIKNPLMVIGGLAGQVERRLNEDNPAREKLRIIQGEVRRLESFLGELRDFLRPVLPSKQEVDLNEIMLEVKALMSQAAEEKGLNLEDHLAPRLPRLYADPNQLNQVLVNLIKNAIEATERGDRIILSTGSDDNQVWFSIQDNGKGMSPEVQEKIFHPFFTTKEKGTGLGLAVIHKIITDHNGTIALETVPGAGSTFTIRLPQKSDAS